MQKAEIYERKSLTHRISDIDDEIGAGKARECIIINVCDQERDQSEIINRKKTACATRITVACCVAYRPSFIAVERHIE